MGSLTIKALQIPGEREVQIDALVQDQSWNNRICYFKDWRITKKFALSTRVWNPINQVVLERVNDQHFTCDCANFNEEINLDPLDFSAELGNYEM